MFLILLLRESIIVLYCIPVDAIAQTFIYYVIFRNRTTYYSHGLNVIIIVYTLRVYQLCSIYFNYRSRLFNTYLAIACIISIPV